MLAVFLSNSRSESGYGSRDFPKSTTLLMFANQPNNKRYSIYRCYVASEGVMQKCCTRKKKTISAGRRSPSAEMVFFLPSAAFFASHPSEIRSNGILT